MPQSIVAADPAGGTEKRKPKTKGLRPEPTADGTESDGQDGKKRTTILDRYQRSMRVAEVLRARRGSGSSTSSEQGREEVETHDLAPMPQPARVEAAQFRAEFDAMPRWLAEPRIANPSDRIPFDRLPIRPATVARLVARGLTTATGVQTAMIPLLQPGPGRHPGDVCVAAATGSGKTAGYAIPIAEDVAGSAVPLLRAVIVVPTRELVAQVKDELEAVAAVESGRRLGVGTAVGNVPIAVERSALTELVARFDPKAAVEVDTVVENAAAWTRLEPTPVEAARLVGLPPGFVTGPADRVDVLVATPGRLAEHVTGPNPISLAAVRWLVLDEADRLLDSRFRGAIDAVLAAVPATARKVIVSATMKRDVEKLAGLQLHRPVFVAVVGQAGSTPTDLPGSAGPGVVSLPESLQHHLVPVGTGADKPLHLAVFLASVVFPTLTNLKDDSSLPPAVIVFVNRTEDAHRLAVLLSRFATSSDNLLPDQTEIGILTRLTSGPARKRVLGQIRTGAIRILIASDRAGRGLDPPGHVSGVVNYDVPTGGADGYVHRVGRTARAGRTGFAWTFTAADEDRSLVRALGSVSCPSRVDGADVRMLEQWRPVFEAGISDLADRVDQMDR